MASKSRIRRSLRRVRRRKAQRNGAKLQRQEGQTDTDSLSSIISNGPVGSHSVQTKLKVGSPDSPMEKQADKMADSFVQNQSSTGISFGEEEVCRKPEVMRAEEEEEAQPKLLQRQEEEEEAQPKLLQRQEEEEEEAQPKLLQRQEEEEEAQPKLLQRQEEEEEAQPKLLQRQEEEEEAQPKLLQRQEEKEEAQPKLLQRQEEEEEAQAKTNNTYSNPTTANVSSRIEARKGMGNSLPKDTQSKMESHFRRDFSKVRIHNDSESHGLSQNLNAQAFTIGKDVYFNRNKFNPNSKEGQHLLAHELTHVVQQNKSLDKKIQRHVAATHNCQPAPNPVLPRVRSRLYPILRNGALGVGNFGLTRAPQVRITFVSIAQRERRNCNHCRAGRNHAFDLWPRRAVVLGTIPVTINRNEIRRRGAGGQRWFMDCNSVFDVRHITPAAARASMGRPRRVTMRMTRRHEMHHVRFINNAMNANLRARNDIQQICPYSFRGIRNWKRNLETTWRTASQTFARALGNTAAEETAARNHTC